MESYTSRHKSLKGVWDDTSLVKFTGQIDWGNLLDTSINSLSSFPVSVLLNSKVGDLEFQIPNSKPGNYEIQLFSLCLYTGPLQLHQPDGARSPPGLQRAPMVSFHCWACTVVIWSGGMAVGAGRACAVAAWGGRGAGTGLSVAIRRGSRRQRAGWGAGPGGLRRFRLQRPGHAGAPGYGATRAGSGGRHRSAAAEQGRAGVRLRGHRGGLRGLRQVGRGDQLLAHWGECPPRGPELGVWPGARRTASLSRGGLASQAVATSPPCNCPHSGSPFLFRGAAFCGLSAGLLPSSAGVGVLILGSATRWGGVVELWRCVHVGVKDIFGDDDNGL